MPRPARPWFRFYSEATENLKVHELPDRLVKPWLFMLCLANTNNPRGRLPSIARIAFALRVKEDKAKGFVAALVERGLVDVEGSNYVMHEWNEWQADRDVAPGKRDLHHANVTETPRQNHDRGEKSKKKEEEVDGEKEGEGDLPPAYRALKAHWENKCGFLSNADVEAFREFSAALPAAWFEGAIDETAAAHAGWAYCRTILQRCLENQEPPSSIRKANVNGNGKRKDSGEQAAGDDTESVADQLRRLVKL